MSLEIGLCGEVGLTVTEADTAIAMGSGEVRVLSTPRVVGLCEAASMAALAGHLAEGQTSVGSRVELSHLAPILPGTTVAVAATLERVEGKRLVFNVAVNDPCGLVAAGKLTRVVVNLSHFMDRAR